MDDRRRYPIWQKGLTSSPLMVQGHGARPSNSQSNDSPRRALEFSGRAVSSHLNRMRHNITGGSQVNIQELLKQATEDLDAHKFTLRYKNGVSSNWMYNRDQDISSALFIKGMDTDSKVMNHTYSNERPTTVKVIRANIPRAEMEEQEANRNAKFAHSSRQPRTMHRRPSTADAVRRIDIPEGNYSNIKRDQPIKLPITAWDTANEGGDNDDQMGEVISPRLDKELLKAPSPPNSLNSDDEGFLSNAEEENRKPATTNHRDADEDILINGQNYDRKTDQLLKYYIDEEHGNRSPRNVNTVKHAQERERLQDNVILDADDHPTEAISIQGKNLNHVNSSSSDVAGDDVRGTMRHFSSGSPDSQASGQSSSRNDLQSSIIMDSPQATARSTARTPSSNNFQNFQNFQNHSLRRSRSPRRSNTFLHRRSHHSPWRTYNNSTPQETGGLATAELRSSFIEITNPLNLQCRKKPPVRPTSINNSFIGHGLHSYRPRGRGTRSIRVSVSNPDLTSIRVVGTSMSSSNTFRNIQEGPSKKFPHSSYSAMT